MLGLLQTVKLDLIHWNMLFLCVTLVDNIIQVIVVRLGDA